MSTKHKIAIIGLGYVGLPLARLFATKYPVVGFDINTERIDQLNKGTDHTLEVENDILQAVLVKDNPIKTNIIGLYNSNNLEDIKEATIFIVTVPTPVDKNNRPDLTPLYRSSESVGKVLKKVISLYMNRQYTQV